jgi:hypothetical protein
MDQDDDKQTAQLIAYGEMSSLLKTQQPFSVILQEITCMTGLLEGILEITIDSEDLQRK